MALTNEKIARLKCDFCKKPFDTYPKKGQKNLPDEVPYIRNGIIIVEEENKVKKYYHGYVGRQDLCFEKAMGEDTNKPNFNDDEGWAITRLD